MNSLTDLFFSRPDSSGHKAARTYALIAAMFLAGGVHWILFFDYGRIPFEGGDWPKEHLYYQVLQEAVQTGTVPYHVDQQIQTTHRFLALPEKVLSPQILLLRFLDVGQFVMANTLVMYAVGFWGCLVIRRRYGLSLVSFALLYVLFLFNGHITAHIAAGHSMWNGYFLMPFYCYFVLRLCETTAGSGEAGRRIPLLLALVLFVMNLQGSFHMYVWCVLFLALLAVFNREYVRPVATVVVFSVLLSLVRLLPAAITFWNSDRMFLTGYPTIGVLLAAFVSIQRVDADVAPALVGEVGWWEYDLFIGAIGLAAVLYLGIWLRWRAPEACRPSLEGTRYRQLDWPMAVMSVLSLGAVYGAIAILPLPLVNSEANPSRFLIVPFLLLLTISCIRLDRVLTVRGALPAKTRSAFEWLILAGLIQTAFELATHSKTWAARNWARVHSGVELEPEIGILSVTDRFYEWSLYASLAVSSLTLMIWMYRFFAASVASDPVSRMQQT